MSERSHMLDGYRVLDFSQIVAGPTTTRLLAEMGAEVIKVELAPDGELSRRLPYLRDGRSAYFVQQNRGKKSLCVDVRQARGRELLLDLAAGVDVVVENFSPGVMWRLGFDWPALSARNPGLVMCSISAFGQDGPLASLPGYDYIAQAYAGFTGLIGESDGSPYFPQLAFGDMATGGFALAAVLAALLHRERGGSGQYLDISLLDVYVSGHEIGIQAYSASGGTERPRRTGAQHGTVAPLGIYKGAQGYLVIAALQRQFEHLCTVIGQPELAQDARFADNAARVRNIDELTAIIEGWLGAIGDDDEAMRRLTAGHVPVAPVLSVEEMMRLDHVRQRQVVRRITDRALGAFDVPGSPLRFSAFPDPLDLQAPFLGEHNAEVLATLGLDAQAIAGLEAEGILVAEPVTAG